MFYIRSETVLADTAILCNIYKEGFQLCSAILKYSVSEYQFYSKKD